MLQDSQGLIVRTNSQAAIAAINRFMTASLSYGKNAQIIFEAITADSNCALANAYAATYYLTQESAKARTQALPFLEAAKKYFGQASEREQLYVSAILAWAAGNIKQAIAYHEEIAEKYPRDLLSVQMGQYHYFYQGNFPALLNIAEKVLPANRENHFLYGMIAFGLEQCHRLQEAESIGRQAVAMNRQDAWAQHAVAHVMEMQGRLDEGITWMESFTDTWEDCNSMLYTHNWWHIALYYLEKEDIPKVLELYNSYIWGRATKESSKDQVGAISLLLRLELRGIEVGTRWQEISDYLTPRIHEHSLPFQDLHYVYALAKANKHEQVKEMLLSMADFAKTVPAFTQKTWIEVAVPAAKGIAAYAQKNWQSAIASLRPILSRLYEVGGSHAQRDLFEQLYLDAWLRNEHNNEALRLISRRVASGRFIPSIQHGFNLNYQQAQAS